MKTLSLIRWKNPALSVMAIWALLTCAPAAAQVYPSSAPLYESIPNELVIYQGNMAYARDSLEVFPSEIVSCLLPPTSIRESVEITDGGEKVQVFSFSPSQGIISPETRHPFPGFILSWKPKAARPRQADMSYLLTGLSWTPVYNMTILSDKRVLLRYGATINNTSRGFPQATVKLVSGMVSLGEEGPYLPRMRMAQRAMVAYEEAAEAPEIGAARLNVYYVYYVGKLDIAENGTTFVTLVERDLPAEKEHVWATAAGERVDVIYAIANEADKPLADGQVDVYEKGVFMGRDPIEWTPSGSKGHVTIGGMADIRVKRTVDISRETDPYAYHHRVALKIENFGKEDVELKIIEPKYPDSVRTYFEEIEPTEIKAGTYMWKIGVPQGKAITITYGFYSDREHP